MADISVPQRIIDTFGSKKAVVDLLRAVEEVAGLSTSGQVTVTIENPDNTRRSIAFHDGVRRDHRDPRATG